jgi:hypothetical protein
MKTNQIMHVSLGKGVLEIGHLDHFGSLNQVFSLGNAYRIESSMPALRQESWRSLQSTKDYISLVSKKIGKQAIRSKKGKNGGTWAHLRVLLDAAMYLSPDLKDEVIEVFVESKILSVRDESGNNYIELNAALALNAVEILGKPSHRGHYITVAKVIKKRLGVEDWNIAPAVLLSERARLEEVLSRMLNSNVVRDWDHLKELAEKV